MGNGHFPPPDFSPSGLSPPRAIPPPDFSPPGGRAFPPPAPLFSDLLFKRPLTSIRVEFILKQYNLTLMQLQKSMKPIWYENKEKNKVIKSTVFMLMHTKVQFRIWLCDPFHAELPRRSSCRRAISIKSKVLKIRPILIVTYRQTCRHCSFAVGRLTLRALPSYSVCFFGFLGIHKTVAAQFNTSAGTCNKFHFKY